MIRAVSLPFLINYNYLIKSTFVMKHLLYLIVGIICAVAFDLPYEIAAVGFLPFLGTVKDSASATKTIISTASDTEAAFDKMFDEGGLRQTGDEGQGDKGEGLESQAQSGEDGQSGKGEEGYRQSGTGAAGQSSKGEDGQSGEGLESQSGKGSEGEGDPEDLVEFEGETFFYVPDVHAKGEETHANRYKTRDKAEEAGVAKIARIQDRIAQLKEVGKDVGALPIPSFLEGKLDDLGDMQDLSHFVGMDSDQLRKAIKELDQFDIKLGNKYKRVTKLKEKKETNEKLDELQGKVVGVVQKLAKFDKSIGSRLQEEGLDAIQDVVVKAIQEELNEDQSQLQEWIDEQDELGELSLKEFNSQLREKQSAIDLKRKELEKSYAADVKTVVDYIEAYDKFESGKEKKVSPEQIRKQAMGTFEEFQADITDAVEMFKQDGNGNPIYPEAIVAFQRFALNPERRKQFNNYSSPREWSKAYKAYEAHKEELRSKRREAGQGSSNDGKGAGKQRKTPPTPPPSSGSSGEKRGDMIYKNQAEFYEKQFDNLN